MLSYFYTGTRVTPISPLGLVVATAGAFVILGFYRLLAGRIIREGQTGARGVVRAPRYRSRRYVEVDDT